ncbi:hypothetical protein Nepgr_014735 [Nepenthes gracilis]|uniref:Uncharacterized protein n=1 Tax=Nepenthes gracilis TaxID=150966 RepID=A0AAD3SLB9_NEPGR|nr:hypothetical protein Nepgr_014735 [Nepenthes gracilis]
MWADDESNAPVRGLGVVGQLALPGDKVDACSLIILVLIPPGVMLLVGICEQYLWPRIGIWMLIVSEIAVKSSC